MDGLEIHGTDIRRALITDAPALTFQALFHGRFREFAPGHQGPLSFRELSVTSRAAQPFDVFVGACPRSMHDVACSGAIEACTLWIRARESGISLLRWRRLCHSGPPVARYGPKDTDLTPVFPRYYSPGLPIPWALSKIPCARTRALGVASCFMISAKVCRWLSVRRRTYRMIITPEVSVVAAQKFHTMYLVWGRYLTKKFLLQHLPYRR
jgi:hypothetical protein